MKIIQHYFRCPWIQIGVIIAILFFVVHPGLMADAAEKNLSGLQVNDQALKNSSREFCSVREGGGRLVTIRDGRVVDERAMGSGARDVIIQLREAPLFSPRGERNLTTTRVDLERSLARVKAEILRLESQFMKVKQPATQGDRQIVKREYHRVFNGIAASVRGETIQAIRNLPDVERVWPDGEVRALLSDSVPLIQADRVHQELGFTGRGVVVAIVDTGIDYTHPDLGGCFGPGCKVAGGYDFFNDDPDPMDDNGHGTHMAGIVAAQGGITGVAPDATLMAYKVLGEWGSGSISDVIAAIEKAVDPDGDPATADGAQVINLSLGQKGDPDDPLSQAVDNAVAAGAVVVVAAGDMGGYDEMFSPAMARQALTVGATDKTDELASLSTRGPAPRTFQIKPEVLAPGMGITSTVPTGTCQRCDPSGYLALDGTSASAAHAAGVAALLLEEYPDWGPQEVKGAIMAQAIDLGLDAFTQGSGRIDAYASSVIHGLVNPANLSLGLDDIRESTFERTETLTLTNLTGASLTYDLEVQGVFPAGITITVSPDPLTLGPGETGPVEFHISVDNATVPNVPERPYAYEGAIVAEAGGESLRIPFAFIKSPVLELAFHEEPYYFAVHNRVDFYEGFILPALSYTIPLAEGIYDVIVDFPDDDPSETSSGSVSVLREGVDVSSYTRLEISQAEAIHTLTVVPTDKDGNPLQFTETTGFFHFYYKGAPLFYTIGAWSWNLTTFKFSSMSDAYRFEVMWLEDRNTSGEPGYTFYAHAKDGIDSSVEFENRPEDFKHVVFRYEVDPGIDEVFPMTRIGSLSSGGWSCSSDTPPMTAPFEEEYYLLTPPHSDFRLGFVSKGIYTDHPCDFEPSDLLFETLNLRPQDPQVIEGYVGELDWETKRPLLSTSATILPLGIGPYSWFGRFDNSSDEIRISSAVGYRFKPFLGQLRDWRPQDPLPYELYQDGTLIETGDLLGLLAGSSVSLPVTPGAYTLRVPFSNFYVAGEPGRATMTAVFDTNRADRSPPYLTQFQLFAKGEFSDTLPAPGGEVRFEVFDEDCGIGPVSLAYDTGGGWSDLPLEELTPGAYTAILPGVSGDTPFVALRLVAEDNAGNRLELEISPAFRVERVPPPGGCFFRRILSFTIAGCNQWTEEGDAFIGPTACKVKTWTDTSIVCRVRKKLLPDTYDITIVPEPEGSAPPIVIEDVFTIRAPEIASIEPARATAGSKVKIYGRFFGRDIRKVRGRVFLGSSEAGETKCKVHRWRMKRTTGESKIKFIIPEELPPGTYDLIVENKIGRDTVAEGLTVE
jgi:subtilisin family serine protease